MHSYMHGTAPLYQEALTTLAWLHNVATVVAMVTPTGMVYSTLRDIYQYHTCVYVDLAS